MYIRTAELTDLAAIKKLYQAVALAGTGIARLEHEVTDEYIHNFITRSLSSGLIIVAEHPENKNEIVAEIHAYKPGIKVFDHVLSELTIAVHPDFQGKKLGRTIFTIFLEEVGLHRPDIGKVELIARESNTKAIALYQSMGFRIEGRLEMRLKTADGLYEADIPMGWQNPNFEFD
ncbi:GNAT family N-acetyltransferase [Fulvivirgaceae bacterium PWU4]|uniref:GNAT family N-acetyltransferase n=1 Tax=Chryseosolibacter histidini TaxID=2782349 RepID=A0AAP2DH36_9BACT|nr:GNAT family N-acetyltransferase [Chryseosolibacter histidini]MBT1696116.1 GNAT family N-acetyltransferase [Chryseosolibacter histidini]